MRKNISWQDNLYLIIPFVIMILLYGSSSMTYQDQSILSNLEFLFNEKPLQEFLSSFEFIYGGQLISIENSGYFSFIEFFIRKGAHFFIYFLLGFFWYLGLRKRVRHEWLTLLLALMLSIGYASFDELRQSFNPGRSALMADVLLDTAAAVVGIGMAKFFDYKKVIK